MALHPELLEIVRCPKCLGRLTEKSDGLACPTCKLLYPVENEIPNFMPEEARPLS
jgi:uncharacterized protein YbaR (Trm112 family)